jgi:hypothetical protein
LSLAAAGLNVLYSIYVVLVSFTQDVERGWTSMSLQVSGMFFLTLVVLAALSEFMIFLHKSLSQEPKSIILGEVTSPAIKSDRALNVETRIDLP